MGKAIYFTEYTNSNANVIQNANLIQRHSPK